MATVLRPLTRPWRLIFQLSVGRGKFAPALYGSASAFFPVKDGRSTTQPRPLRGGPVDGRREPLPERVVPNAPRTPRRASASLPDQQALAVKRPTRPNTPPPSYAGRPRGHLGDARGTGREGRHRAGPPPPDPASPTEDGPTVLASQRPPSRERHHRPLFLRLRDPESWGDAAAWASCTRRGGSLNRPAPQMIKRPASLADAAEEPCAGCQKEGEAVASSHHAGIVPGL